MTINDLARVTPTTVVTVVVDDTAPVIHITALDTSGSPADLTGITAKCLLYDRATSTTPHELPTETTTEPGELVVPWPDLFTELAKEYGSTFRFTDGTATRTLVGPPVAIYDPAALWADPAVVHAMTGGAFTDEQVIAAILVAEDVVRAWVTEPITSPVSDRVRMATALLAARALTSSAAATGSVDTTPVVAESIGDYSVRYAYPTALGSTWIIDPDSDIAALLAPWRPPAYDVFVGRSEQDSVYPITAVPPTDSWWWWEWEHVAV